MTVHGWPPFWGHTLFCDDARTETTGKRIYIGVYTGKMIVNTSFPYLHPRLSFNISYSERIDTESKDVLVKVSVPGNEEPVITITIRGSDLAESKKAALADKENTEDPSQRYVTVGLGGELSPFLILSEGLIRVRAYRDGDEIRMGTLEIIQSPQFKEAAASKDDGDQPKNTN